MKLYELKRAKGDNRYCGPAVISFVTGISTGEAAALIRQRTGRRAIIGTSAGEVANAYRSLGIRMRDVPVRDKPTLAAWLRGTQDIRTTGRVFLVVAGNHWQLITGRRYACGRIGEIVSIKDPKVKRRARVTQVFELTEMEDCRAIRKRTMDKLRTTLEEKKGAARSLAATRQRCRRLANEWGIDIEVDDFGGGNLMIYCFPPEWFQRVREEDKVLVDSICRYSWEEAETLLEEMNAIMAEISADKGSAAA